MRRAGRKFFARDSAALAERLIGTLLVRTLDSGERLVTRIVETEAYLGVEDAASHAFGGRRTARTEPMYGPPGTVYVYFTYGMHYCFNIVCGRVGLPPAVLIRAAEPLEGLDTMRRLRGERPKSPRHIPDHDLCRGPARLAVAMAIGPELNAADIAGDSHLSLIPARPPRDWRIVAAPRIGIARVPEPWRTRPLRWLAAGHPCVSVQPPRTHFNALENAVTPNGASAPTMKER
ncbi:MAG: DNA-3-methyladenine glycosylase [Phycisphaerales bacterium]